jgi:hypothetical protein
MQTVCADICVDADFDLRGRFGASAGYVDTLIKNSSAYRRELHAVGNLAKFALINTSITCAVLEFRMHG